MEQCSLDLTLFPELSISNYDIFNNFELPEQCEICYKLQNEKLWNILMAEFMGTTIHKILDYFPHITEYRLIEDSFNLCLNCVKQLILSYLFLVKIEESNKKFKGLIKLSAKVSKQRYTNNCNINQENKCIDENELTESVKQDGCILEVALDSKYEESTFVKEDTNIDSKFRYDNSNQENEEDIGEGSHPKEADSDDMVEHIQIIVEDFKVKQEERLVCDICDLGFKTAILLKNHVNIVHKEKKHDDNSGKVKGQKAKCEVCHKYFNKYVLKSHMERHSETKRHKCDICEMEFFQLSNLNNHMIRHQEPKFCCDYCNKPFFTKQEMLTHVRRQHTREIICTCQHCGKGFVHQSNLIQHVRNCHSNENDTKLVEPKVPKQCNDCGKMYSSRTSLFHHIKRAHENRQYPCSKCDMTFRNLVPLKSHLKKIHDVGGTHVCNICDKHFTTKEVLSKHTKRKHTTQKLCRNSLYLRCTLCKIKFNIKHELIQHIHGEHIKEVDATVVPLLYECNICMTFFVDVDIFHSHLLKHSINSPDEMIVTEYSSGGCNVQSFTHQKK